VEATEEAVVTTLLAATDVTGRDGRTLPALRLADVLPLLQDRHPG
jgi:L-aminopeptidase/D-esterase-like protein